MRRPVSPVHGCSSESAVPDPQTVAANHRQALFSKSHTALPTARQTSPDRGREAPPSAPKTRRSRSTAKPAFCPRTSTSGNRTAAGISAAPDTATSILKTSFANSTGSTIRVRSPLSGKIPAWIANTALRTPANSSNGSTSFRPKSNLTMQWINGNNLFSCDGTAENRRSRPVLPVQKQKKFRKKQKTGLRNVKSAV